MKKNDFNVREIIIVAGVLLAVAAALLGAAYELVRRWFFSILLPLSFAGGL